MPGRTSQMCGALNKEMSQDSPLLFRFTLLRSFCPSSGPKRIGYEKGQMALYVQESTVWREQRSVRSSKK